MVAHLTPDQAVARSNRVRVTDLLFHVCSPHKRAAYLICARTTAARPRIGTCNPQTRAPPCLKRWKANPLIECRSGLLLLCVWPRVAAY